MGKKQTSQIPNILLSVKDASVAISVSTKMVRLLIASGRLKAVNLGKRMTRISFQELTDFAERQGCSVMLPSSSLLFNNDRREKKNTTAKPETGSINRTAKCRMTPASEKAPEGVTHKTHYTMAEVMSKFNIKYGRLYEIRNRYQLASVHAWGTTAFKKEDVEKAIAKYDEEPMEQREQIQTRLSFAESRQRKTVGQQGKAQQEAYYTCFDIMQKYGLGKTQVRRFAETHGVRIKKAKGGRANLYLKADWWKSRARLTPEGKAMLTPENFFILTPLKS